MIKKKTIIAILLISSTFSLLASGVKSLEPYPCCEKQSLRLIASVKRSDEIERYLNNSLKNCCVYPDGYNVDPFPYLTINKIKVTDYKNQSNLFVARSPIPETKVIVIIAQ